MKPQTKALALTTLFLALNAQAIDMNKLKQGLKKGAEEGIKTGKVEGAKKGVAVGVKTAAEELKTNPAEQPAAQPVASEGLAPSLVCDSVKKLGICYAFTGTKHIEQHAEGQKQAAKKKKKGPICANDFACSLMKGKYQEASTCPKENAVGKCLIKKGSPEEYTLFYYSKGKAAKDPEKDCTNKKSSIHAQGAGDWTKL